MSTKLPEQYKPPFRVDVDVGWIYDAEGIHVLDLRAWGFLTGYLGLDEEIAATIQDSFGEWVVEAMNEAAERTEVMEVC